MILLLTAYPLYGSCDDFEGLLESLESSNTNSDELYNTINNIDLSAQNLKLILAIWQRNSDKYPHINWEIATSDQVKIAIANVLTQAHRNCLIKEADIRLDELHEFMLAMANSSSPSLKGRATLFLGLSGYESDIPFLTKIVLQEKQGYAEEAVMSISFIHKKSALQALESLKHNVSRQSLRDFIDSILSKYQHSGLREYSENCTEDTVK